MRSLVLLRQQNSLARMIFNASHQIDAFGAGFTLQILRRIIGVESGSRWLILCPMDLVWPATPAGPNDPLRWWRCAPRVPS